MRNYIVIKKIKKGKYNIIENAEITGGEAIDAVSEWELGKTISSFFKDDINPSETLPKVKKVGLKKTKMGK